MHFDSCKGEQLGGEEAKTVLDQNGFCSARTSRRKVCQVTQKSKGTSPSGIWRSAIQSIVCGHGKKAR